jgi:hypothetical protein
MSRLEPGERVLKDRKLEPKQLGSSLYRFTDKELPVFIEDVRLRLTKQDPGVAEQGAPPVVRRNPAPLSLKQRRLSSEASTQEK